MAIGLNTGSNGGDFLPYVSFNATAGRMFRVDRTQQSDGSWASNSVDLTAQQPTFLLDFLTLETGWLCFAPPSFATAPLGQPLPDRPSKEHKQGFRARVFSPRFFAGLREFSSTSKAVIGALDALHTAYEAAPEAAAGKLPVVKLTGSAPITTKAPQGTSTNYAPTWEIVSWADRPADWSAPTVPAPRAGARTSAPPAAPVSNHVPPPVPKPVPEPALADNEVPF